ncbi:hypothetical protein [Aerosakkonema funiforme]|uniref:hypothetical protein n=1 Tax=Aerosakkonema funiforme TaxID=1246630 RepID=UPI0035BA0CE2
MNYLWRCKEGETRFLKLSFNISRSSGTLLRVSAKFPQELFQLFGLFQLFQLDKLIQHQNNYIEAIGD